MTEAPATGSSSYCAAAAGHAIPADRGRLLSDAGIIRNRLKISAAIENARRYPRKLWIVS